MHKKTLLKIKRVSFVGDTGPDSYRDEPFEHSIKNGI